MMTSMTQWYNIKDLYSIKEYKITHSKNPKTKWIKLPCVYKIKIANKVVHVGRSDTCKKHGGAEKVRKAIVNLLNINDYNPSVPRTKLWNQIRLQHKPNSSNIRIGIIKTNAIEKTYLQERIRARRSLCRKHMDGQRQTLHGDGLHRSVQ